MSDDETMDAAVLEVARVLVAISETGLPERMRGTPDRQRELATWADALRPTLAALKARWQAEALREAADDGPIHFAMTHQSKQWRGYRLITPDFLTARADALGGEGDG